MLVRYTKTDSGQTEELAKIYTIEEHGIKKKYIDPEARKIIHRLEMHGYSAYIVGGAIRDLLIGRKPKDFDIVTDAHPGRIRKLFWNSRIIGRRFRIVHVYAGDKVLEVSTFRSSDLTTNNAFGTMKEDVTRRDFSMNALYYAPNSEQIFDYVGAMNDILDKKMKPLRPLKTLFKDDPVRIIRAVRYSAITGFSIPYPIKKQIKTDSQHLQNISPSRLTEEVRKILSSGKSERIFEAMFKLRVLRYFLPELALTMERGCRDIPKRKYRQQLFTSLHKLDRRIRKGETITVSELIESIGKDYIQPLLSRDEPAEILFKEAFRGIKKLIQPITPPNKEVEQAVRGIFYKSGLKLPSKKRYHNSRKRQRN